MAKKRSSSRQTQLEFGAPPAAAQGRAGEPPPKPAKTRESVFVIDSYSLIYQVFHAMPEMTSPTGQPVGAIHGFIRDIVEILQNCQPDYLFCAFDAPGDTFRQQIFPQYKMQRQEMPLELRSQIEEIRRMLAALSVPILELPGFEADDILATIARLCEEQGRDCFLVTADKDCRQLITDCVRVFNIRKNEMFDAESLKTTWGIRPDQVIDYQTLVGDPIDNIPGVPLIGPKSAQELLQKYETLEGIYQNLEAITGKKGDNLRACKESVLTSRQLVKLDREAPIEIDWEAGRVGGIDAATVADLCREFGFRQLAERLSTLSVKAAPAHWQADYQTIDSLARLDWLVEQIRASGRVSIDTETTSIHPRFARLVGYSFCWKEGEAYYVPVRAPEGEPQLPPEEVAERLRALFEDPSIEKVGQNVKYEMIVLRTLGIMLQGAAFDTMVADYLLDPGERNHNLDDLAKRYLNHTNITIESLIGTGKNQRCMDEVPVDLITQYAAEDADVPLRLERILRSRLEEDGLAPLFHDLEMPLVEVLAEMEYNGIAVDTELLKQLSDRYGQRMEVLQTEIHELAGGAFNINSPKQLAELLFTRLKLPVIKRTQTGPSTDVEVLEELAKQHPLPAKIIEYRQNSKLKSGFVDALPTMVHPETGRVHTSFKQDVAATGRLSSSDPNLQNIPVRNDAGREIRAAFRSGVPGWQLLCADYSQIELRVLAHFSSDETLLAAFANDDDIHTLVASQVYGVERDRVDRDMRRSAKTINFGVIYGQSAFGLAKTLDIPQDEAQQFIDAYFARYPGVDRFMEATLDEARRRGFVTTISGRRRPVQGVRDAAARGTKRQRLLPERIAINSVIQGSAADLIKMAMIRVHRRLRSEPWQAKLLLQIHDELVFEAPPEELPRLRELVVAEMSGVMSLSVPLKVDVKVGLNWAECE
jgi:DNA polymerase I